ncbi:MAG: hypothetical protein H7X84_07785 [Verrucomicrobia bacterium]|nr:hypothetical protein [Prolixibacteraceae bacterium]
MEKAKMIKMHPTEKATKKSPIHFKGAITSERAVELTKEIDKSRDEWDERTI